jgi:hypothetical protein
MVQLGTGAPDFFLPDAISGRLITRDSLLHTTPHRRGLLILFVCVHCPYVKHLEQEIGRIGREYFGIDGAGPIAMAAIQSNDVQQFPEDGPDGMREQATRCGWNFPYLLDATQEVARAYEAACTPDFFLYDGEGKLVYRGQMDDSRPRRKDSGNDLPVTGRDLRAAIDAVVARRTPDFDQRSSIGCNIKWRE